MENTVDDTGGFDLREWRGEWRKEHDPMPDRRPGWVRVLVFLLSVVLVVACLVLLKFTTTGRILDPVTGRSIPLISDRGSVVLVCLDGVLLLCVFVLLDEFRKRGWMKPTRKPMPSSATAVMEHYDVTDLTFDGDRCLPVKNGLHKCVFVGAGRACDGFLRRKGDHVWLYGPDGNEWPAGTGTR